MKRVEIGDREAEHVGNLGRASIGALGPVYQLGSLLRGDFAWVLIATQDPGNCLLLRQLQLARIELGMEQQVDSEVEHLVAVRFETRPGHGTRVHICCGFNLRGLGFKQVVQRVAVHLRRAAGAPNLPIQAGKARLGCGQVAAAAMHLDEAIDKRQLVVFLEQKAGHRSAAPPGAARPA